MKVGVISPRVLIRRALSTFLASTGSALVVMEGYSLPECIDEIKRSRAEMLIVDLDGQGIESLPDLKRLGIVARVVVLMDDLDGTSYARAFQLGIWGCLSTNQSPMFLQKALDCVARGERWMPQQSVMNGLAEMREQGVTIAEELTPREWQVLGLMANGFRNKEIAARLGISDETVKSHAKSIYGKLKIKGRRDAIFRYFEFIRSQESASDKNPAEPSLR